MIKRSTKLHDELRKKVLSNPECLAEYKAFSLQLEMSHKMKEARKKAKLTQAQVAKKMGTQVPAIARLERGSMTVAHNPSLTTLSKYAQAIGRELKIEFVKRSDAHV